MAVRRPLIIDGGSIKELPSGDTLPAPGKTAATLTHSGGVVTLDVQAADVFRFEADEYVADLTPTVVGSANNGNKGSSISLTGMGLQEDDEVFVLVTSGSTWSTPSGWTLEEEETAGGTPHLRIIKKRMGTVPDTTVNIGADRYAAAFAVRGVDLSSPFDAPTQVTIREDLGSSPPDAPSITTITDNALVLALMTAQSVPDNDLTGGSIAGYSLASENYGGTYTSRNWYAGVYAKVVSSAGVENPGAYSESGASLYGRCATMALRGQVGSGEKDFTFTLSNIPSSGIATGLLDIELKTDTGSVAFAGGTVTWRGTEPAFDAVGHYLIGFIADATGITLWREA